MAASPNSEVPDQRDQQKRGQISTTNPKEVEGVPTQPEGKGFLWYVPILSERPNKKKTQTKHLIKSARKEAVMIKQ